MHIRSQTPADTDVSRRRFMLQLACGAVCANASSGIANERLPRKEKSPIVDAHMHVWADDQKRFPFDHPYQPEFEPPAIAATVERLVDEMDQNGVTHCILVQTIYHGWDNRYTAHCVAQYPERLKGHGLIDPAKPDVAEKLEFGMREQGLAGMRLSPIYYLKGQYGGDGWLTSRAHHRLWRKAAELKAVFNFFIAPQQLPRLEIMLRQYPEVRVVIDHFSQINLGADNIEPATKNLLAMAQYPNAWVKVSELTSVSKSGQYPFADAYSWVERVYDRFGPSKLIWGTGYPGATRAQAGRPTLKQELELLRKMSFFTEDDRRQILGLNAAHIWNLKAAPSR